MFVSIGIWSTVTKSIVYRWTVPKTTETVLLTVSQNTLSRFYGSVTSTIETCHWGINNTGTIIPDTLIKKLPFRVLSVACDYDRPNLVWLCTSGGLFSMDTSAPGDLITPLPCCIDGMASKWPSLPTDRENAFKLNMVTSLYYSQSVDYMIQYCRQKYKVNETSAALRWTPRATCGSTDMPNFIIPGPNGNYVVHTNSCAYFISLKTQSAIPVAVDISRNSIVAGDGTIVSVDGTHVISLHIQPNTTVPNIQSIYLPLNPSSIYIQASTEYAALIGSPGTAVHGVSLFNIV